MLAASEVFVDKFFLRGLPPYFFIVFIVSVKFIVLSDIEPEDCGSF